MSGDRRSFAAGEVVRVRDEAELSLVVLPTDQPADCVPGEVPEVAVYCVPIALVRTPIEGGDLRWVEISDLSVAGAQPGSVGDTSTA